MSETLEASPPISMARSVTTSLRSPRGQVPDRGAATTMPPAIASSPTT